MTKHDQDGAINILLIPLILTVLLLFGSIGFGAWAFSSRSDYKNNVDQKIAVAVAAAIKHEDIVKDAQFAEAEKQPLKSYSGSETYGSIKFSYPKTWSALVNDAGGGSLPIDAYLQPDIVGSNAAFALRVKVLGATYSATVASFNNQVTKGVVTVNPYQLAKVPNVVGVRVDGQIEQTNSGSMVILPVRDKTLEIFTESTQFLNDFNNIILPNFSFSP